MLEFEYYGQKLSQETFRFLRYYLTDFISSDKKFPEWLANKKLADSTKKTIAIGLGLFLISCNKLDKKVYNELIHKYQIKEKIPVKLTNDTLNLIFDYMNKSVYSLTKWRNLLYLYLLIFTGKDSKSILNIKTKDINCNNDSVTIKFNDSLTKINNNVLIKNYNIKYIFAQYIKIKKNNEYFFINGRGNHITSTYIQILFEQISKTINIKILPNDFKNYKKGPLWKI